MIVADFDSYTVVYSTNFNQLRLYSKSSENFYYWLTPLSRIDNAEQPDKTLALGQLEVISNTSEKTIVRFIHQSNIWQNKCSYYIFTAAGIEHYMEITGKGTIDRLHFGLGLFDNRIVGSTPGFDGFIPGCPNFLGKKRFFITEYFSINVTNETSHWGLALNSGPLFYCFYKENVPNVIWSGIIAPPGTNIFSSFDYNCKHSDISTEPDNILNTQSWSLAYNNHLTVDGSWESPHLFIGFANDFDESLNEYCSMLTNKGAVNGNSTPKADWWMKPIFCGWHEQVAIAKQNSVLSKMSQEELETSVESVDQCTQKNYEHFVNIIKEKNIPIGTIIIDAKWQQKDACFVENNIKWPNMRRFIDSCHADGLKVVLWLQAWGLEGLSLDECILENGQPICMDPTSPKYQERLERGMQYTLSSDLNCLNADGFKIDYTNRIPIGPHIKTYDDIYGFELQHYYLEFLYKNAKQIKSDAMVSLFIANPYFRDVCDIIRLGDYYSAYGRPVDTMLQRAQVARIAMCDKPIDTDGTFTFSMENNFFKEFYIQADIGIPTLYQVENVFQHRAFNQFYLSKFDDKHYDAINKILNNYNESLY